jgi:hypothetical protein
LYGSEAPVLNTDVAVNDDDDDDDDDDVGLQLPVFDDSTETGKFS